MLQDEERLIPDTPPPIDSINDDFHYSTIVPVSPTPSTTSISTSTTASATPNARAQQGAGKRFSILEPPVFLNFIALFLSGAVIQNQILFQTCVSVYHYNESVCEPLRGVVPKTDEANFIENEVQPYVAQIIMGRSLMSSLLPAFLSLFIGPWSDKFGRRPVLLVAYGAGLMDYVLTTILVGISSSTKLNPWMYMLGSIPSAITGGSCAATIMMLCYISDIADERNKAKRMFYVDAAMGLGLVIGNLLSSYLLAATNVVTVLGVSTSLSFLAFMYIFIFVKESLKVAPTPTESKIRGFFNIDLIKDLVRTCLARRPNYDRGIIWLTMITSVITSFIIQGESNVFYLFLRSRFNVTLKDFTEFNAIVICIKIVGCVTAMIMLKRCFNVPLAVIAMLGLGGSVLESVVRAAAQSFWEIYLSTSLGFLSGITGPMLQAIMAIVVPTTEFGKICAVTTSLAAVTPLGSAPLYSTVYSLTLNSYPGAFNVISATLYLLCFIFITSIFTIQKTVGKIIAPVETIT